MTISQFIKLTRPRTLTAAFSPVCLGAAFSYYFYPLAQSYNLSFLYSLLILLTVIGAQIAANIWNEYFDYKSGLDANQTIGNSGAITREGLSPKLIKKLGYLFTLLPAITGFSLAYMTTPYLIPVGVFCIAISFFYSAGPMPLSRTPLGDLASGIAMGFAITLITAFIWAGQLTLFMLIAALPSLLLIAAILMANNLRDIKNDTKHGRHTLAIVLGRARALHLLRNVFIFCNLWLCTFVFMKVLPLSTLIACISAIPATKAIKIMHHFTDVVKMDHAMGYIAKATTTYHLLFAIGLLLAK